MYVCFEMFRVFSQIGKSLKWFQYGQNTNETIGRS